MIKHLCALEARLVQANSFHLIETETYNIRQWETWGEVFKDLKLAHVYSNNLKKLNSKESILLAIRQTQKKDILVVPSGQSHKSVEIHDM